MTATVNPTEPIPGYRLLDRLGQGGFGEVWKAEAPGGLLKAIKIVYGNLNGSGDDEVRVRQELKALERVKSVRHPYILSLERFDIIDNRLFIVMELADRSLQDRFRECQAQGLPGIPREELLRYMEETAEALDLMNIQYQLQHLDIKPQNLFLVHNHIKVGDFGLVKDLEGMRALATSGLTPVYAAPETFEGVVSRYCDQYHLAIVYQELLTGKLPFSGSTPRHLMLQHLTGQPDLSALPEHDRPAIARALSKKPEDRHPTCADLVRALRQAGSPGTARNGSSPEVVAVRPATVADATNATTVQLHKEPSSSSSAPSPVEVPERPEVTGDGVLFPALVIGVGGAALGVLQQLRKALHKRCGPPAVLPHIRLLYLDTDPEAVQEATQGEPDGTLAEDEVLLARLQRPSHYLKPGRERQIAERWLNLAILSHLPRDQVAAGGNRAMGRLAFVTNYPTLAARLRAELEACLDPEALTEAGRQTGLTLRTNRPRVYVVSNLAGGTGSGMFLDLAYTVRRLLRQMGCAKAEVVGLCLLPAVERGAAPSPGVLNTFAALTELGHFAAPETTFAADYLDDPETLVDRAPPFHRCLLLPSPPPGKEEKGKTGTRGSLTPLAALAGDFLARDLVTPLGRIADEGRTRLVPAPAGMTCQTFGAFWFAVPRRLLLQRVGQSLCHRLVQAWRSADPESSTTTYKTWIEEQLARVELTPEGLVARLEAGCVPVLGQLPEVAFEGVLQRCAGGGAAELARNPQVGIELLAEVERLVGPPDERADGSSALAQALGEAVAALGTEVESQLSDVALRVLAEPRFRLTGAEEAVNQEIVAMLAEEVRSQNDAAAELARQAATLYETAVRLLQDLGKRSFLWRGNKTPTAAELLDALRKYARTRRQCLTLGSAARLYEEMLGSVRRYLRDVNCCRPRIAQLLQAFADPARRRKEVDLGLGRYLLPTGCRTLEEGAARILDSLAPQELQELNEQVQALIGAKFQAQVHICTAPANFFKDLEEGVHEVVAAFAEAQLGRSHAAELYLEQNEDDAALADLAEAFDEAIPELAGTRLAPRDELCILAVPPGPEGDYFRGLVRRALPDREFLAAASTDDIIFYREHPNLALAALPHVGPAIQEAYRQAAAAKQFGHHSRYDIITWLPLRS
ncbi:MAG TPA: tubulin-like doman-containing protein [Gemmataceae bacterium]|nr:tubulin-like doman-containing protein [Gemmataceae bacterium]